MSLVGGAETGTGTASEGEVTPEVSGCDMIVGVGEFCR